MGLQAWYPLINDMRNQGVGDTDLVVETTPTFGAGKIGNALISGGNSHWTAAQSEKVLNNNAISICFWVYIDAPEGDTNKQAMFFGNNEKRIYSLFNYPTCNDFHWSWYSYNASGEGEYKMGGALKGVLPSYYWTHVAITYNNPNGVIYINGEKEKTFSGVMNNYTFSDQTPVIYQCAYRKLNDFRIYDHALSPREVKEISKGLVLHYPLAMPGQENIIANTSHEIACTYPASGVKDYYSVRTKSVPNETQYTLSFEARSTVDGDHLRTHFYNPNTTTTCESSQGIIRTASDGNMDFTLTTEWRRYWVVYTQTETNAIKSVICPRLCSPASYPSSQSGTGTVYVRNQKLERGSRPTPWIPNPSDTEYSTLGFNDGIEYDVSGYQHNGTKVGTITYDSDTPRYNTSAYFNGSSDIRSAKSSFGWFDFKEGTVAAWFKPANTTQTWASVGVQNDGGVGSRSFSICNYSGKAATVVGYDSSWGSYSSDYSMSANVWYHLCATITNGDTVKLYVNGELVQTRTVTNTTGTIASTTQFAVGVDLPGSDERFTGHLSDVRFYTTCLNESDVRELYNTSMSLSNNGVLFGYEFIE